MRTRDVDEDAIFQTHNSAACSAAERRCKQTLASFPWPPPTLPPPAAMRSQPINRLNRFLHVRKCQILYFPIKTSVLLCWFNCDTSDLQNCTQLSSGSNKAVNKGTHTHTHTLHMIQLSGFGFIGILADVIIGIALVAHSLRCWVETLTTRSTSHFITKTLSSPFNSVSHCNN